MRSLLKIILFATHAFYATALDHRITVTGMDGTQMFANVGEQVWSQLSNYEPNTVIPKDKTIYDIISEQLAMGIRSFKLVTTGRDGELSLVKNKYRYRVSINDMYVLTRVFPDTTIFDQYEGMGHYEYYINITNPIDALESSGIWGEDEEVREADTDLRQILGVTEADRVYLSKRQMEPMPSILVLTSQPNVEFYEQNMLPLYLLKEGRFSQEPFGSVCPGISIIKHRGTSQRINLIDFDDTKALEPILKKISDFRYFGDPYPFAAEDLLLFLQQFIDGMMIEERLPNETDHIPRLDPIKFTVTCPNGMKLDMNYDGYPNIFEPTLPMSVSDFIRKSLLT